MENENKDYFGKYVGTIDLRLGLEPGTIMLLGIVIVGAMWAGHAGNLAIKNILNK